MKECKNCKQEKCYSLFSNDKTRKDGKSNWCKICIKVYKDNNKENIKIYNENYNILNKDYIIEYGREYRINNIEKIRNNNINYRLNNPNYQKNYLREKYKNNPLFRLNKIMNACINQSFKSNGYTKTSRTYEILGCSFEEFKLYLESKFMDWMTWENQGLYNGELNYGWDIDHITPISSAKTEDEVYKLNHFSNLQPLCSKINREIKRDLLEY